MKELRPYQQDAIKAILEAKSRGMTRLLIVMATGLGKTLTVAGLIQQMGVPRTFGFMHRQELIVQSKATIEEMNPGARVGIDKAAQKSDPENDNVILASVGTVGKKNRRRLSRIPRDWPKVCWIDEAHHGVASSNLEVFDHFGLYGDDPDRSKLLIGTTATPDRLDELGYDKIFDDVVYRYDLKEAIQDGWLARINAWRIETDLDVSKVHSRGGDFIGKELDEAVENSGLDEAATKVWKDRCRDGRNLFYCVSKRHAYELARRLKAEGARVEALTDETPKDDRRKFVEHFRSGELEALVNVQILTEGFDAPEARYLHVLRPTKSRSLYTQIIGRGTRKTETKEAVDVFDYTAQNHNIWSVGRIFGLPDSWSLEGEDVLLEQKKIEEAEDLGVSADGAKDMEDVLKSLSKRRLEFAKSAITDSGLPSKFAWLRPSKSKERWILAWPNAKNANDRRLTAHTAGLHEKHSLWGTRERLELKRNELGRFEANIHVTGGDRGRFVHKIGTHDSLAKFVLEIEQRLEAKRPHVVKLLDKGARWGSKPCSDKQKDVLKRIGVPEWALGDLNKREASGLIAMPSKVVARLFEPSTKHVSETA